MVEKSLIGKTFTYMGKKIKVHSEEPTGVHFSYDGKNAKSWMSWNDFEKEIISKQEATVESLLCLVEVMRRSDTQKQIMALFQYLHKFDEKERAQEMSGWLKSKDFSEEDFQVLAKEYNKQLSAMGAAANKYPELLGTDGGD